MKKIILFSLFFLLTIIATGCNDKVEEEKNTEDAVGKVINQKGETEELTSREICDINDENEAKFDEYYAGASISFVGVIEEINTYFTRNGSSTTFDSILFVGGFQLDLLHDQYPLAEYNKGDKLSVTSNIYSAFGCSDYIGINLKGTNGSVGYNNDSLMSTTIEKIEN